MRSRVATTLVVVVVSLRATLLRRGANSLCADPIYGEATTQVPSKRTGSPTSPSCEALEGRSESW